MGDHRTVWNPERSEVADARGAGAFQVKVQVLYIAFSRRVGPLHDYAGGRVGVGAFVVRRSRMLAGTSCPRQRG